MRKLLHCLKECLPLRRRKLLRCKRPNKRGLVLHHIFKTFFRTQAGTEITEVVKILQSDPKLTTKGTDAVNLLGRCTSNGCTDFHRQSRNGPGLKLRNFPTELCYFMAFELMDLGMHVERLAIATPSGRRSSDQGGPTPK